MFKIKDRNKQKHDVKEGGYSGSVLLTLSEGLSGADINGCAEEKSTGSAAAALLTNARRGGRLNLLSRLLISTETHFHLQVRRVCVCVCV